MTEQESRTLRFNGLNEQSLCWVRGSSRPDRVRGPGRRRACRGHLTQQSGQTGRNKPVSCLPHQDADPVVLSLLPPPLLLSVAALPNTSRPGSCRKATPYPGFSSLTQPIRPPPYGQNLHEQLKITSERRTVLIIRGAGSTDSHMGKK